jgi:hypothetical protein
MKKLTLIFIAGMCSYFFVGCSSNDPEPFDCNASDLDMDVSKTDPLDCASKGSITIAGLLGNEPYSYALDNGTFQTDGTFINVEAGTHQVTVKDKNGCTVEETISLTIASSTVNLESVSTEPSGCKTDNGSITISATGEGALSYSLDNITFINSTGVFEGLSKGTYKVFVKDENGCIDSQSGIRITSGVSLADDVKPIINSNCAISGCHNGTHSPNLTSSTAIISNASRIKSLTQSGAMPKNGSLTSQEKNLIACWVDDGAPNN